MKLEELSTRMFLESHLLLLTQAGCLSVGLDEPVLSIAEPPFKLLGPCRTQRCICLQLGPHSLHTHQATLYSCSASMEARQHNSSELM